MLLLNHLQNQLKLYYPDQAKKHKMLQEELGLTASQIEERQKQKFKAQSSRRASEQQEIINLTSTLLPASFRLKTKNMMANNEREKKGRTHSMTQRISMSSNLESVAIQYMNPSQGI